MKAFVLAAGFGRRMQPITDVIPKPLLPVGNLPLIGYALRLLAHHGIHDVVVNLHHLGKQLRDALKDGSAYGVHIHYSPEREILGTGGGVRKAAAILRDGPFVVINSDTIIDVDLDEVIAKHRMSGALATMVLREDPNDAYGQIEIDSQQHVCRMVGKGNRKPVGDLRSLMFTGVHVLDPRFLEYIPKDGESCIIRQAYLPALDRGELIQGVVMDGIWADAGTPGHYLALNRMALDQRLHLRHADPLAGYAVAPRHAVDTVVRMGEDVDLGDAAQIIAPVLLGDRCRVGDHATVGPYSVLAADTQVGRDARVEHIVLLEGAKVEAGARLRNCIVSRKAFLQA